MRKILIFQMIYIVRNPKDVAVSYYHFIKMSTQAGFDAGFGGIINIKNLFQEAIHSELKLEKSRTLRRYTTQRNWTLFIEINSPKQKSTRKLGNRTLNSDTLSKSSQNTQKQLMIYKAEQKAKHTPMIIA